MRLICPNCAAQYEVDAQMIPDTGRDVQCSNCGQMWFQAPEGVDPATFAPPLSPDWQAEEEAGWDDAPAVAEPEPDVILDPPPVAAREPVRQTVTEPAPPVTRRAPPEPEAEPIAQLSEAAQPEIEEPDADEDWADAYTRPAPERRALDEAYEEELGGRPLEAVQPASSPVVTSDDPFAKAVAGLPPRPRRNLNEAVLSVLREEAERESRARRAATGATFERQSELPLDQAPAPRRRGVTPPPEPVEATDAAPPRDTRDLTFEPSPNAAPEEVEDTTVTARSAAMVAARRELLPDIEEINSTLRATSERGDEHASIDAPETLRRRRSGFRLGFGLMLALAVVVIGFYRSAPMLGEAVPALAPAMTAAVAAIDAARIWLNDLVAPLL